MHRADYGKEKLPIVWPLYTFLAMPAKAGIQLPASHMTRQPCVYILANKPHGTLHVGVTSDLARRAWAHKSAAVDGFTKQYGVHTLVYAEFHGPPPTRR
jgi:hypothetical protein